MRVKRVHVVILAAFFHILVLPIKADVTFDNGQSNTVDYTIDDNVEVKNDTALNLLTNGRVTGYRTRVWDSSELNINGGIIDGYVAGYDDSQIYISSGTIANDLIGNGSSFIQVTGGQIVADDEGSLQMSDASELLLAGGQIGVNGGMSSSDLCVEHNAFAKITGGNVERLLTFDNGITEIRGGTIGYSGSQAAGLHQQSSTHVYGGDLIGDILLGANPYWLDESCELFVHGTDFTINGSPVEYGTYINLNGQNYTDYYLTGTLLSGEAISNHIYLYDDTSLVLIPEPATLLLLALGAVMARKRHAERKDSPPTLCFN